MKKGLTLTETLISVAILGIFFTSAVVFLARTGQGWNAWMGTVDLQEQARKGMAAIVKELRGSTVTANAADTITFNTSSQTGVQCYRDAATNQLIREYPYPNGTKTPLAYNINGISFCWLHSDGTCCTSRTNCGINCATSSCTNSFLLQITITASKTVKNIVLTNFTLTQKVKLRNAN
jgi:prepilin-type N-terminal cleavage/methylation domain-containing protein